MFTLISKLLSGVAPPKRLLIEVAVLVIAISGALVAIGGVRSCSYKKAKAKNDESRKQYDANEQQLKTQRDQIRGQMAWRHGGREKPQPEKDAYKTMAEQDVRAIRRKHNRSKRLPRRRRRTLMKPGLIWIVALVLSAPFCCYAQQSLPSTSISTPSSASNADSQDDPVLKALNEMTIRAIAAEAKVEQYELECRA